MLDKNYFPGSTLHSRCPRYKGQRLSQLKRWWHSSTRSRSVISQAVDMMTAAPVFIAQLQSYTRVFFCQGKESCWDKCTTLKWNYDGCIPGSSGLIWEAEFSQELSSEDRLPGTERSKSQARLVLNTFSCSIQFIILFFSWLKFKLFLLHWRTQGAT